MNASGVPLQYLQVYFCPERPWLEKTAPCPNTMRKCVFGGSVSVECLRILTCATIALLGSAAGAWLLLGETQGASSLATRAHSLVICACAPLTFWYVWSGAVNNYDSTCCAGPPLAGAGCTYILQSGDSLEAGILGGILQNRGITAERLQELNPGLGDLKQLPPGGEVVLCAEGWGSDLLDEGANNAAEIIGRGGLPTREPRGLCQCQHCLHGRQHMPTSRILHLQRPGLLASHQLLT